MKNYYEILEISSNASQEVIDRVYKLLAKKYHPDLNPDNQEEAAEKFKEISEAYEILSDEYKRKKHDEELAEEQKRLEIEKQEEIINKVQDEIRYTPQNNNVNSVKEVETTNNVQANDIQTNNNAAIRDEYQEAINKAAEAEYYRQLQEYNVKKAYNDAYVEALKSMGFQVVYKKTFKDYLRIFITFIIVILILIGLWQIPVIREEVLELYEQSGPLKDIIDMIIKAITKNR